MVALGRCLVVLQLKQAILENQFITVFPEEKIDLFEDFTSIINSENTSEIKKYKNAGIRVCVLPDEPFDQIISMALLQKFNAICEGRIKITEKTDPIV